MLLKFAPIQQQMKTCKLRCFMKNIVFKRRNSATCCVKFYDHKQLFFVSFCPQSHIFGELKLFQNFPGDHAPHLDSPRLACTFGPRFNLRHSSCFIGHLWKILLRTLTRSQERSHKDQETALWRLHCTPRIPVT